MKFKASFLKSLFFAVSIVYCPIHSWGVDIPQNLTVNDLDEVVQMLGFSTSSKFLSNPFPLGGYSGFEMGLGTEFVNITDLARLGSTTHQQSTFQYNRISIGKGLYDNLDIFFDFIPFSNANEISEYGSILKWSFYQGSFLPFSLSAMGQFSTINVEDTFINETIGWDLMGGINLNSFALYFGAGSQKATSTFSKNILAPSVSLNSAGTFSMKSSQPHSFVGMHIDIAAIFIAAQIDRYEQPVYSAKLGLRF